MENRFDRKELVEVIEASPKAVGAHDKQAWVSIFAKENIVEDPVGSSPHVTSIREHKTLKRRYTPLEKFYDTFIAPNDIKFSVDQDIVSGNTVIRDLIINITMSKSLVASVPMHLFYKLTDEDGEPKICHLSAHWELPAMIKQIVGHGPAGLYAMTKLGIRMMRYQGVSGSLGFSRGFLGIHQKGKDRVRDFITATNSKNSKKLEILFCSNNTAIEFPAIGTAFSPDAFLNNMDITISLSKEISAGFITTFTFDADYEKSAYRGVGRFEFDPKIKKIKTARFFWDDTE